MKAMVLESFGGASNLQWKEVDKPVPKEKEVLIKVVYAGVNPVDWKIREGYLKDLLPHQFPLILGWDVAGIVVEVGKNVKEHRLGDEVYAYVRKPLVQWGAYAEYVTFEAKEVAKKPKNLSFAEAAALPLVSLTAWQALFDEVHLKKEETILIQGGSGGVGAMAIQFAKVLGAKVLVTASVKKHDYVKKLGADWVIDYSYRVSERVREYRPECVDVVFDCVGGAVFTESLSCLRKGGRIVSILEHLNPLDAQKYGIEGKYLFVCPNGKELRAIADLLEQRQVVPPHIEEIPLQEAALAQEKLRAGDVLGKIVLKVSP